MNVKWNRLLFLGVVASLFTANGVIFYPGAGSVDSLQQLDQARLGVYDDHHPPVMSALWHFLLPVQDGLFPMLILHLLLFWGAIAILGLTFIRRHPRLVYLFPALWLVAPVMGMTGVVWKDTGLAVSWLMAAALAVRYHVLQRRPPWPASIALFVCFLYGLAVRHNAVTGAWPLVFLMITLYAGPASGAWSMLRLGLLSLALTMIAFVAASAVNDALISRKTYIQQTLYLSDLSCLSAREHQPFFPGYILNDLRFSFDHMLAQYHRQSRPPWQEAYYTNDPERIDQLRACWLHTLVHFPSTYLACRIQAFNMLLRVGKHTFYPYVLPKTDGGTPAIAGHYLDAMRSQPVNRPFNWAMLGIALLAVNALRLKRQRRAGANLPLPVFCLLSSGLLYIAAYFLINIGADERFVYWPIAAIAVAFVLTLLSFTANTGRHVHGPR